MSHVYLDQRVSSLFLASSSWSCLNYAVQKCMFPRVRVCATEVAGPNDTNATTTTTTTTTKHNHNTHNNTHNNDNSSTRLRRSPPAGPRRHRARRRAAQRRAQLLND